jgi:short-subunit dehydrogenase
LELTKRWLHEGHRLIASSRNATSSSELLSLQANYPKTLHLLDCDVSQAGDFSSIVAQAWQTYGRIDRWFYNAGAYEVMKMDTWDVQAFDTMAQTNYLGAVRLMVPLSHYCVQQGHGEWVWNASLSSYIGLPYGGGYSAPKAALLNLAESLSPELSTKGIHLRVINHGFVKTRLTAKNSFAMPSLMSPHEAAKQIAQRLDKKDSFEIHFPFGLATFLAFLRILPYTLSLWLTKKSL